ncbi:MAG: hypothetical protein WCX65_02420 [bacterium]
MMKALKSNLWLLACSAGGFVILIGRAVEFSLRGATLNFNDFPVMVYMAEAARRFHAATGLLWGYDPHFMAGYPLSFIWNSNVAIQWFAVHFPGSPALGVVRAFFAAGLFMFPLIWWWTLRNFGLSRREASVAFLLGGLYFLIGVPVMFFAAGMLTAGMVTYMSLFAASFIYRYARDGGAWWIGAAAATAIALFVHKTAFVILFIPAVAALVMAAKEKRYARIAGLAAAGGVALAVNWFWIRPMLIFLKHIENVAEAPFWQNKDLLRPLKDYFAGSVVMNNIAFEGLYGWLHSAALTLLLIAGICGCVVLLRRGNRRLAAFLAVSAAGLWAYSYYGAYLPGGASLNPTRYFPSAQLLLAAAGGAAFAGPGKAGDKRNVFASAAVIIVPLICLAGMVYASNRLKPFEYLLNWPASQEVASLVERIKSLPPGGRIMIEDSGVMDTEGGGQIYGKAQTLAMFGLMTGREFIGGPYPYVFLDYHRVSFQDGRVFGRSLSDFNTEELRRELERYNVKWVICWSGGSREYFRNYEGYYAYLGRQDKFEIFELKGYNPTFFLKGAGAVKADYSRIEVRGARAEGGEIVLKYHWMDGCRAKPAARLERFPAGGDPAGFIRVIDPPKDFDIIFQ